MDFYNINLERHGNDEAGYGILIVDPIVTGSYASRMSHSCDPNAQVMTMATQNIYKTCMFAMRDIQSREELTFDYYSITESEEEKKQSVCFCSKFICRGNYLALEKQISVNFLKITSQILRACSISNLEIPN